MTFIGAEARLNWTTVSIDRRAFLALSSAAAAANPQLPSSPPAAEPPPADKDWKAHWIWYPGQLAAWRHARRMRLAMQRCTMVGYPANYRQRLAEARFRKIGTAARDIPLRWAGPISRIRVTLGGRGGDITRRSGTLRAGQSAIEVQIDFADALPCLLLEGAEFSTGPSWEASLDGEHWVPAESSQDGDPLKPPDAEREIIVSLPVYRTVQPEGGPRESYSVAPGLDLLLDFRETELGALRFEARGTGELTIQVGESVAEVRDPDRRYFEQYALDPVSLKPQPAAIALPQRALRFVRFAATGEAELTKVGFDASVWPATEHGRFESSDPDMNAIWKAAVATLRSNMHDFYLDGIRRDGLVWHDGPLTLDAYERVFFDSDLSRQTLLAETLPAHPAVRDVGIIDAPMYTVIGFEREYLVRGDPAFPLMFRDRIEDILRFYMSLQDPRGFVDAKRVEPYGYFPDWSATQQSGPDAHGAPAYGQMLLAGMFAAGARLAHAWNDAAAEARYQAAAARIRASVRQAFWRPQPGLYANGLDRNGKLDPGTTPFAQAFAVAFDLAEPAEYGALFRFLEDPSTRPAHFSLSQVIELTAYAKAGRAEAALQRLRSAWLPMIQLGYRRFFEDIWPAKDPQSQLAMYGRKFANSLCHAWAGAAPVMAISRGVLGIEPVEPGYRVCTVAPQRCGLEWVRGAVPTPAGLIEVEWRGTNGKVSLPSGITARLSNGRAVTGPGLFPFAF